MAIGLVADADHMMPEVIVWALVPLASDGRAGGIADEEAPLAACGAGIQVELLPAVAVAEGDDPRADRLAAAAIDPGLDGEGGAGTVGRGEVQEAGDVAGKAVGAGVSAEGGARLSGIGLRGEHES